MGSLTSSPSPLPLPLSQSQPQPQRLQPEVQPKKYNLTMKISFLIIASLSLLGLGFSSRLNIPVGLIVHKSLKAMETFFPETRTPLPPRPVTSNLVELMRIRKAEIAAERAREEWAKMTARARELSKEKEKSDEEVLVKREEESVENVEDQEVVQQDEKVVQEDNKEDVDVKRETEKEEVEEEGEGTGEVEERFYSQLELSDMEVSKRGLLNWVMQMEYAGKTFFEGYVFSSSLSYLPYRHLRHWLCVVVFAVGVASEASRRVDRQFG